MLQDVNDLRCASELIVFVIAEQGFTNIVMIEKLSGVAGILARDNRHFLTENAQRAQRNVLQVSYRRSDQVQGGWQTLSSVPSL